MYERQIEKRRVKVFDQTRTYLVRTPEVECMFWLNTPFWSTACLRSINDAVELDGRSVCLARVRHGNISLAVEAKKQRRSAAVELRFAVLSPLTV